MIGAGIFASFAPAAAAAGGLLLVALAIAAVVAYCNANSTARLAAVHPASGGTYVYGTRQLGRLWGYLAGWSFITGKSASCAAMALTVAHYLLPQDQSRFAPLVAVIVVVLITALNLRGVQKSALAARIIVTLVIATLLILLVGSVVGIEGGAAGAGVGVENQGNAYGVLQAAGLLFFAFAGYARIATLGEEVSEPERTIPRAVPIALGITLLLYIGVAWAALRGLGVDELANSTQPLIDLARTTGWGWLVVIVGIAAVLAATGSLLTMILGVSRTGLAMARDGHLPRALTAVDSKHQVPRAMEITVMVAVILVVLLGDVVTVIGMSSFGVLLYYSIANISAMTLTKEQKRPMLLVPIVGVMGCVVLAASVPVQSLLGGLAITAVGGCVYALGSRWAAHGQSDR